MKNMYKKVILSGILFTVSIVVFAQQLPYQNPNLTADERASDLIKRLTVDEKVSLMMDASKAIPRLGIKEYNWWNEALHGVARAGLATVFPEPIGMAATFDTPKVHQVFTVVSDEARAKNAKFVEDGSYKRYQGLTMWTPNVNIFRDPRWGRGMETYGEDPYLSSRMGVAVVEGLQGDGSTKYDKLHACAKHFAVHSGPEWNRHSFDAKDISSRDLYETYLPAFKSLVTEAKVKEVMCAYNRLEGEPCCGNKKLLNHILRNEWGYNGVIVADCGAIADFYKPNAHATSPDAVSASAEAVLSGTDLDCGSSYKSLIEGVRKGYIEEKDIDVSVHRLLKARFELGEMDDPSLVSWTKIPYSVVASAKHDSVAYKIAQESMTLLQNKNNILPLHKNNITVAVVGPNANDSVMLWGNYNGTPSHTVTILDGIKAALGKNTRLIYEKGCDLVDNTMLRSSFNDCYTETGKGFSATYWNNINMEGNPVAKTEITTPFNYCTSGATVFAPGVNLSDFSALYKTTFHSQETGNLYFNFYYCGSVKILVDGKEVKSFKSSHGGRNASCSIAVEKDKSYKIQLEFAYTMGDAQLNFDLGFEETIDNRQTIEKVKNADYVVFVGGLSMTLEGEEMGVNLPGFKKGDRTDIELPAVQRNLISELHHAGKKIIYINCSGSAVGMEPEVQNCDAILQAWYPGQCGGKAVADVLFGDYNPAGRLPITFYKNIAQLPDFENYNMTGRTYRYFKGVPLFPFGYGLSYTAFNYGTPVVKKVSGKNHSYRLIVPVTNSGKMDGDEVVQIYLKKTNDADGPNKDLRAFKRIAIKKGQTTSVEFRLGEAELEWWNAKTKKMGIVKGCYDLMVGGSSNAENLKSVRLSM